MINISVCKQIIKVLFNILMNLLCKCIPFLFGFCEQGSAADVAMCAMLEINQNAKLRELGWKLLLQVRILELNTCCE